MRNNYSNYLGVVTSAGASDEHPLSIHSASIGTRWKPRGLQVLLTLVFLFSLSIGQMWADNVVQSFSGDDTGDDEWAQTKTITKSTISVEFNTIGAGLQNRQRCKTSGTSTSAKGVQLSSSAGSSVNEKFVGISSSTAIVSVALDISQNGTTSGRVATAIYFDNATSKTPLSHETFSLPSYDAECSSKTAINLTVPSNCKYIRLYKQVKYDATNKVLNGTSGSNIPSSNATNFNIFGITVTAEPSTSDVTPPTLSSSNPANSATDVAVSGTIVLTFSEALASVDASKFSLEGATIGTVAKDGTDSKKVNVPYSGAANSATVTLSVAADAVADAAGNKSAALSNISFTTIAASGGGDPEPRNLFKINMTATSETSITHGTKVELTSTYGTVTGGYTVLYNKHSSDDSKLKVNSNGISISGNDPCVILYLNEPLHVGDKIEFTSSVDKEIKIGVADDKDVTLATTSSKSYTVASEGLASKQVIYLWRVSSTTNIKTLTISSTTTAPTFRTVTFDPNYTGSQTFTRTPADGTKIVYVPKDPVNGTQTFEGWFDGSAANAFDFANTAITANKTLTAHWTAPAVKYSVTYAAGEGSGTMTDANEYKENDEVTVLENAFTTPAANKKFSGWSSSPSVTISNGKFSMPASNVTLTAQWTEFFTITYKDGESTLKTEDVFKNAAPVGYTPTKALNTFAGWKDGDGNTVDPTTLTAAATLFAQWTKTYANSVDFETYIGEHSGDKDSEDKAKTYVESQNYALSTKTGTTFDATTDNNGAYKGLKIKHSGTTLSWNVAAGKLVIFKTGYMDTNGSLSINGGAATAINGGSKTSGDNFKNKYFYSAAEALYVFTTGNANAAVVKAITIQNPFTVTFDANGGDPVAPRDGTPSVTLPSASKGADNFLGWFTAATGGTKIGDAGASYTPTANITLHAQWEEISTDARLASITFSSNAGTLSPAFDPEVVNYTYTMPYKTAAVPTITGATSVNANAKTPIIGDAATAWGGSQTIKGVAQSGDQKTYTITMQVAPKDGISLIKVATTGGTNKTVTGVYAGDGDVNLSSSKKMDKGKFIGFTLNGTALQAGDKINVHTTQASSAGNSHIIFYDNMTDKNELYDTEAIGGVGDNIFTINADMVGKTTAYVYRASDNAPTNWNGFVDYIEVTRAMDPVLKAILFNSVDATKGTGTTFSAELPYGTNLGTMTITPEIIWNGAAAENSILINGSATGAWAWGTNTYKLTDKDGDATTYTITLTEAAHYEAMIVGGANYETLAAAVAAAQADDVVKLLDNVDLMTTGLTIAENITLDLNGFNIKAGEQIDNDILVPAGKKLTLVDNSENHLGKIYTEQAYTGAVTGYGLVRVAGELLMQSGNIYAVIDSDPANLGQFAVVLGAGGKATIEGGQIKAGWYAISNNGNNTGSTIVVKGGELISTADFAIYNPAKESTVTVSGGVVYGAAGGIAMNRGELTVTGGTITSKDQGSTGTWGDGTGGFSNAAISASGKYESVEVEITGGTIIAEGTAVMITNGTTNPVEIAISGGQFSHVVPAEYCAPGFAPVTEPNAQGKYEVEDKRIYIFDGSTMSNIATSPSGAIAWEIVGSTMGAGDKDKTYEGVHYTRALSCGSSSTTKHFRIDVALNNAAKIEVIGMSNSSSDTRHAWLTNSTEKGEYASAIAGLATTGYNPEMFTTDWLEEGSYYLHSDNTVAIFLIRVTSKAVPAKCEAPVLSGLANLNVCTVGSDALSVTAETTDGGTFAYQWYKKGESDTEVGTNSSSYTPTEVGQYYVVVTHSLAEYRDNATTSDVVTVSTYAATAITSYADVVGQEGAEKTISVTAEGANLTYQWQACDANGDVTDATVLGTAASLNIVIASETKYYLATVTGTCGVETQVVKAEQWALVEQADVTGSITWDWNKSNNPNAWIGISDDITITATSVLANVNNGIIPNNNDFRSDMLKAVVGSVETKVRKGTDNGCFQGNEIMFHTIVPGTVTVTYRGTGNNANVTLTIGSETLPTYHGGFTTSKKVFVPAGDVVISSDAAAMRVQKIVFNATPDYTRNVSNNIGTLCVDHNVPAGQYFGATFYQIASRNELYDYKIDFEEVLPNEELKAGEPYIFQSTTGRIDLFFGETEAENPVAVRGMIGNYDASTLAIDENNKLDILYIAQNKLWTCENLVGQNLILNEHRAYIDMTQVPTYAEYQESLQQQQNSAPGRRRVTLGTNAEQVATGFDALNAEDAPVKMMIDGKLFILRGEKMYDATGRLVK